MSTPTPAAAPPASSEGVVERRPSSSSSPVVAEASIESSRSLEEGRSSGSGSGSDEEKQNTTTTVGRPTKWYDKWINPVLYPPGTWRWYREAIIICTIFSVTGSSSMMITRPLIAQLGLEGFWQVAVTILCVPAAYSIVLSTLARICGRWPVFRPMVMRMWGWLFRLLSSRK